MITRPLKYPDWAENGGTEIVNSNGTPIEVPYRTPVPTTLQDNGLSFTEGVARQVINQQFYEIASWIKYLDNNTPKLLVGSLHSVATGGSLPSELTDIATWVNIGTVGSYDIYTLTSFL